MSSGCAIANSFRSLSCGDFSLWLFSFLFFVEVFAMKTIDHPLPESITDQAQAPTQDPALPDESALDLITTIEPTINGFDGGTRAVFKEPSIYLSIAIVFIATTVCLSKTPTLFWLSLGIMTAVAVMFHVMAERFLFRSKKEHQVFAAPLEGVFVITLGAILPGLSLLAYGIYSLTTAQQPKFLEEIAKLILLLVVPFFNFAVWSAVRRRYHNERLCLWSFCLVVDNLA